MKYLITVLAFLLVAGVGGYFFYLQYSERTAPPESEEPIGGLPTDLLERPEEPVVEETPPAAEPVTIIGESVQGNPISAYHYGTGDTELLFIGGMHGGYSWNTVLVAYQIMDYLDANPSVIPNNVKVTVIPVVNPDGLQKVVGSVGRFTSANVPTDQNATIAGRFNANNVDINRNFDCEWQASGVWQDKSVSGGSAAFSEPESQAIKQYVDANRPAAVVVYYSAVGGVFASNCRQGILAETLSLTNLYAEASGYRAYETFDFYAITGDAVNWLAKNNIPAISVLLTTHQDTEWSRNKLGVDAMLQYYAQ